MAEHIEWQKKINNQKYGAGEVKIVREGRKLTEEEKKGYNSTYNKNASYAKPSKKSKKRKTNFVYQDI